MYPIVTLDYDRTETRIIWKLPHIHDLAGRCRKNRAGLLCQRGARR